MILLLSLVSACTQPSPARPVDSTPPSSSGPSSASGSSEAPIAEATVSSTPTGRTRFHFETATDTGLAFEHTAGRSTQKLMPEIMGGGVLIADFNQDFAPDVLFINSGEFTDAHDVRPAPHAIFLNDGQGGFTDATEAWGIQNRGYGMGGAVGDFDNDGYPDAYLTTFDGQDQLLRNTGNGFVDVTEQSGISNDGRWSTSAGFFDMENDGDLDLYVVKYVDYDPQLALPCYNKGFPVYCTPVMFQAERDRLFRNNGDGTFTDISEEAGVPTGGKGLALAIGDVDRDGDPDIYVANDTTSNLLLINDGQGHFEDQANLLGVGNSSFGKEEAGMGVDFTDVNDDGLPDIVCTNFQSETTSVYLQQAQGHFLERSDGLGVGKTARQRLSFGVDFFDADNDGDEDLIVANGHVDTDVAQYQTGVSFGQQNTLYEMAEGKFTDVTDQAGAAFEAQQPSRGLATADLDLDGDLDFIVINSGEPAQVALNRSEGTGQFITLWLTGTTSNASAIGAVVEAHLGEKKLVRRLLGASSYLSGCLTCCHLGLGDRSFVDRLVIRWPDGESQTFEEVKTGRFRLEQGGPLISLADATVKNQTFSTEAVD